MHDLLEVVLPPVDDLDSALEDILAPYEEGRQSQPHGFWDYWMIGGRYSGEKVLGPLRGEPCTAGAASRSRAPTVECSGRPPRAASGGASA